MMTIKLSPVVQVGVTHTPVAAPVAARGTFCALDTPQAAAAFGAQIQSLCLATQPKLTLPTTYLRTTALVGVALLALADLLA